jgi:hypothetical protein
MSVDPGDFEPEIGLVLDPSRDPGRLRGYAEICDRKARIRERNGIDGEARRFRRLAVHYRELADERSGS